MAIENFDKPILLTCTSRLKDTVRGGTWGPAVAAAATAAALVLELELVEAASEGIGRIGWATSVILLVRLLRHQS